MWVLRDEVIYLNAFYSKNKGRLSYKEITKFSNILVRRLYNAHIPFIVRDEGDGDPYVTFMDVKYILLKDEAILCNLITEDMINKINSIYDEKIQKIIIKAREEYAGVINRGTPRSHKK